MTYKILPILFAFWTQAQAYQSSHDSYETVEVTYEELAQELAMKKKEALPEKQINPFSLGSSSLSIGYSFSSLQYQLSEGAKAFSQNGLDIRWNQKIENSNWKFETGFKNYGSASAGQRSAEGKVISAMGKTEISTRDGLAYTFGIGSSINWTRVREEARRREALDLGLNATAGITGPFTRKLNWHLEAGAISPLSSKILKGGIETSLLISSSM